MSANRLLTRRTMLAQLGLVSAGAVGAACTAGTIEIMGQRALGATIDNTRGAWRWQPAIGICGGPSRARAAKSAGAAFMEVSCRGELRPESSDDASAEVVDHLSGLDGLKSDGIPALCANSFLPGSLQATGPEADHDAIIEYARIAFRRAQRAGLSIITFGSSGARSIPDDYPVADADLQFTALLARLAGPTKKHGVTVCVEPLRASETNYINLVSHAHRLVRAVNHPNIGITADFYHMLAGGEGPDALRRAARFIKHVHVAELDDRRAPGTTGVDFRPFLRALQEARYNGRIAIECRWKDFDAEVGPAVKTLREQVQTIE